MIVSRLAGALDRRQFRSVVCLYGPGWLKEHCERQGFDTHVLEIGGMFDFGWVRKACRLVRREGISLIHAHEFTGNTYGSLVAKLVGVPLVATVHGKIWPRGEKEPEDWMLKIVDKSPNLRGTPAIFGNSADAEIYLDNLTVKSN